MNTKFIKHKLPCPKCDSSDAVSLNADGTQEETAEFYSYVKPLIVSGSTDTVNAVTAMADI